MTEKNGVCNVCHQKHHYQRIIFCTFGFYWVSIQDNKKMQAGLDIGYAIHVINDLARHYGAEY